MEEYIFEPGVFYEFYNPGFFVRGNVTKAILPEDFESYAVDSPPDGNCWIYGCIATGADNAGVTVDDEVAVADGQYVILMLDVFGTKWTFGNGCEEYSYIQILYEATTDGTISFDYYHTGWDTYPNPVWISCIISFSC